MSETRIELWRDRLMAMARKETMPGMYRVLQTTTDRTTREVYGAVYAERAWPYVMCRNGTQIVCTHRYCQNVQARENERREQQ